MPTISALRSRFIAAVVGSLLFLLLAFLGLWSTPVPSTVDLRMAARPQFSNGVLVVSVVLSNGTARSLNVVDDAADNPHFILDAGAGFHPDGSATHVVRLGPTANTLKVNLGPGASLTNSVSLTSPPPRFRLSAEIRDLAAERRRWWVGPVASMLPQRWSEKLSIWRKTPMPASEWIEMKMTEH